MKKIREGMLADFAGLGPVRHAVLMARFGGKLAGELHVFLHRPEITPG